MPTMIVCKIDCIHNTGTSDDRCRCTTIGVELIGDVAVCDSYMRTPKILKEHNNAMHADGEKCPHCDHSPCLGEFDAGDCISI